jgi:hypothetical protein
LNAVSGRARSRLSWLNIVLIPVVFIVPMVGAWVLYYHFPDVARSWGTSNYGTFVDPPRHITLPDALHRLDGRPLPDDFFHDMWTYVYFDRSDCDKRCQANLYKMRQVRLAQGKDMERVQRLFVLTDDRDVAKLRPLLKQYPDMAVATAAPKVVAGLVGQFRAKSAPAQRVYLVDMAGNAMMYYEPDATPDAVLKSATGMRKDLGKLIRDHKL